MSKAQDLAKMRARNGRKLQLTNIENVDCKTSLTDYYESILPDHEIAHYVDEYKANMDQVLDEFYTRTGLNAADWSFCILAIALQCVRQYGFTQFHDTIDEKATKKSDEEKFKRKTEHLKSNHTDQEDEYYAPLIQICSSTKVPYDTINGSKQFDIGLGGHNHRYKTLGHDPILGYVFGTMNIVTNTLTTWEFNSYHILNNQINHPASTSAAFSSLVDRVQNEPTSVAAALIKQSIHLQSDMYTPNKIPFPIVSTISPDLSLTLSKYGINCATMMTIGKQAGLSIAINAIIAMLHGFYCNISSEKDAKLNEVKTRKILLISNVIASSSNILYTAFVSKSVKTLDVGGLAVTLYRIFSDPNTIRDIKYEFLNTNLSQIYDEEYQKVAMYFSEEVS